MMTRKRAKEIEIPVIETLLTPLFKKIDTDNSNHIERIFLKTELVINLVHKSTNEKDIKELLIYTHQHVYKKFVHDVVLQSKESVLDIFNDIDNHPKFEAVFEKFSILLDNNKLF